LLQGKDSLRQVARAVGLHPRSLERHLKAEGASFDALRDEVRFVLAKELLALTSLPVGEIGASLNYGSHSSFVHAFQRWAATTPTKWRQKYAAHPAVK
jgi:AraC-like DNA-binding protein